MQDQYQNSLVDPLGECTQSLLNLIILGRATPYLHNGVLSMDNEETQEVNRERFLSHLKMQQDKKLVLILVLFMVLHCLGEPTNATQMLPI